MNSFNSKTKLNLAGRDVNIYSLKSLDQQGFSISRLPFSLRILLENLLRTEGQGSVFKEDIEALAKWDAKAEPSKEIAFTPARTLLQDFTGVPCVVDLAAMRDAMAALGGDPKKINPLAPVELVIDHSVQVDAYGSEAALMINRDLEFERNQERYEFLKWGQQAFDNFKVVPPNTGIVHQVNLEHLARVVFVNDATGDAYPDTLVGTDSHTTMINGLGVLGWGVGGIEAEAAMLGQPVSMLIPQVIGFKLSGSVREGVTSTDLVLTVTEMLRKKGVVGKFVEFFGPGLAKLPLADRATIGNMAPEYGATCGIFPVDAETLRYMRTSGRSEEQCLLVEAYMREQGLWHDENSPQAEYTDTLELDLSTVEPSVAGPKRPQDRVRLSEARTSFRTAFPEAAAPAGGLCDGAVVIAAITSCTNTSNPYVMMAAGLVAKKAHELGLSVKPWVKTSLAPGSRVVTSYLEKSGLNVYLDHMKFNTVGYGCTTCIGNSGPLREDVSKAILDQNLTVVSVLSGNRNFEGRISAEVKANYLMSPPLVVAYAIAGTVDIDLQNDPLGFDTSGAPIYLKDIWPTQAEVADVVGECITGEMFRANYADVFKGDEKWNAIEVGAGDRYDWVPSSTYVKKPPYFEGMERHVSGQVDDLTGLGVLAILGDSVTTDHISPAGSIKLNSPAGEYLTGHMVKTELFNSYGSRRGNHEVMVRGTFANVRLKNQIAPGTEGGYAKYWPTGEILTIFDASERYQKSKKGLIILAGKEYGSGSSRDWAAKGPHLLGVKVVIAQSYERIHRSNLIGMGILPLQFLDGENAASLGLDGSEEYAVMDLSYHAGRDFRDGKDLKVHAVAENGDTKVFGVKVRIDTPKELEYYRNGGILQYVLRQLLD
ncbi:MAG: aconitate hydratase AcnA [Fimbriimonadaceae bacterium]